MSLCPATRWGRYLDYGTQLMRRQQRDRARSLGFAFAATAGGSIQRMAEATGVENPDSVRKRLERTILSEKFDLARAWDLHRQFHLRALRAHRGLGSVVAVDGTATEHMHAKVKPVGWNEAKDGPWRGMDGVGGYIWHGSSKRKLTGHPYVNIEIITDKLLQVPLVLETYDSNEAVIVRGKRLPRWKNDWQPFEEAIGEARHWSGDESIYVFDRGFHLSVIAPCLDRWNLRFALRVSLKSGGKKAEAPSDPDDAGMWVARLNGSQVKIAGLATQAPEVARFEEQRCRAGRRGEGPSLTIVKSVPFRQLIDKTPVGPVRMLVVWDAYPEGFVPGTPEGEKKRARIAIICDRELPDLDDVLRYRAGWIMRWSCETTFRFWKNRSAGFGLQWEDRRQLDMTAIRRMNLLCSQYAAFLSTLDLLGRERPGVVEPLLERVWVPGRQPKDRRYRLALGFSRYLQDRLRDERNRRHRIHAPMWTRIWEPLMTPLPG